jgi:nicotinamide mononucleotide transporter
LGLKFLEYLSSGFNVGYILLAVFAIRWCWVLGFIGSAISAFVFFEGGLYSDSILQIYYAVLAIIGWFLWGKDKNENLVFRMSIRHWIIWITFFLVCSTLIGKMWSYFGATLPYFDAILAVASVMATQLTIGKYIESWILWIFINIGYLVLYSMRSYDGYVILTIIYLVFSFWGWYKWKKLLELSPDSN